MCARYGSATEFYLLQKTYKLSLPSIITLPQQIIYPHTPAPAVVRESESLQLKLMNYSLIPHWSKERKPKFATYNARIEEVLSKPSWKEPFKSRRCLIPIKFFIESVHEGPFAGHNISIEAKDHHLLSAAGIWDSWTDLSSGNQIESMAIITGEPPSDILKAGHDRCPIFLAEEKWNEWLTAKMPPKESVEFLKASREVVEFEFKEREKLKNYNPQLVLFNDDE